MRERSIAPTGAGASKPPKVRSTRRRRRWRSGPSPPVCLPRGASRAPPAPAGAPHRHYRGAGNAALARPVVDIEIGYCLAPMDQGIRLTTGVEFAARDAAPTPVQFDRLLPAAK